MKKDIMVNNQKYRIDGVWSIDGFTKIFNGNLFGENNYLLSLNFRIPVGFIKKYGQDSIEEDIEESLIEELSREGLSKCEPIINKHKDDTSGIIDRLLEDPIKLGNVKPLTREEIYRR